MTTKPVAKKYNPDHELSDFPPDSGFLKIAVEQGYVGLIINMLLFLICILVAVSEYFHAVDNKIRTYLIAFITFLFSNSIGMISQNEISQIPLITIFSIIVAFIGRVSSGEMRTNETVHQIDNLDRQGYRN